MPKKIIVKAGAKFGTLTFLEEVEPKKEARRFKFLCHCGKEFITPFVYVRNGTTKSCGCYRKNFMKKHGMYKTKIYRVWSKMMDRCYGITCKSYPRYGGRGIKVSKGWHDFGEFFKDMGEFREGYSLDRINNDGDYSKQNCRWASPKQQMNNNSRNRFIEFEGKKQTLAQWGRELKISSGVLHHRLKKWSLADAFTIPVSKYNPKSYGRRRVS